MHLKRFSFDFEIVTSKRLSHTETGLIADRVERVIKHTVNELENGFAQNGQVAVQRIEEVARLD